MHSALHSLATSLRIRLDLLRLSWHNVAAYGRLRVFSSILIETYSPCNRRCTCCPVGYERRAVTEMSEETFQRIIDQLAERNYQGEIGLHFYNEPLLDKRIPEFVSYAHAKCPASFIYFATNGDFLEIEAFRDLVRRGLSNADISQYDKEPSERLKAFLAAANDEDRKHFVYNLRVIDEIPLWYNRAGSVKKWSISKPMKRRCTRPETQLIVDAQGRVPLCCCDYYAVENLGDVTKENVFDIWNSKRLQEIRSYLRAGQRHRIDLCSKCNTPAERVSLPRTRGAGHAVARTD